MRTRIALILLFVAAPALAVKTSHWLHTTESDFKDGTSKNVVATNLGDLKLSRQVKSLIGENPRVSAVFAMAQASDGTIYAGTGPEGLLLAIKDEKVTTVAELGQHASVLSLVVDPQGRLYIGTGAEKAEILRIDKPGEKPHPIFSADDVQYIWAMTRSADGTLYAATGPNGQLFQINPDGSSKVLCDTDENNLMCLIDDGKDNLYFGTDPNGLVCRVNRKTGEMFVLYDVPEDEINALARDAHGNVYAGTAQSIEEANAEPDANAPADQGGRPEGETRGVPIPSKPPPAPAPQPIPGPAPGEPLPIPKGQTEPMSLLILAGEEGPPGAGPTSAPAVTGPGQHKSSAVPLNDHEHAASNGNAVYRIDPDGFVTEVFRQPASVFAIVEQGGSLLVATGNEGNLYQVNPAAEESLVQAKLDAKQIMCLLPAKDGRILMGTANSGDVIAMTSGFAPLGTYTSPVLDAVQISRFGKIQLHGTLPGGTALKLATRSGNIEDAASPGWSNWSEDVPAAEFMQSQSPAARFFQYRLTFTSEGGAATPVVEEISVAYQVPNLAPQIKAIKIPDPKADDDRRGTGKISITWMATDPNEDDLSYSLYFRNSSRAPWILLKDKLKDPTFDWDTRSVADGRYEIKVEASDAAGNPVGQGKTASRVSDPIVVDNTPPVIGDIHSSVAGADATIKLNVVDRATTVARLEYSVDSSDQWQTVLPSDNIADSPQEAYDFVIKDLPAGAHQIALRASDSEGNRAFESVSVTVERK